MQFSPLSGKGSYSAGEHTVLNPSGNRSIHNISQSKHFLNKSINYILKKKYFLPVENCYWTFSCASILPLSFLFMSNSYIKLTSFFNRILLSHSTNSWGKRSKKISNNYPIKWKYKSFITTLFPLPLTYIA